MASKGSKAGSKSGRSGRIALVIAVSIVILFSFAALFFHYFVNRPPSTNYCGPLGYWLARGLDKVFGWFSLLGPILLAMLGVLYVRRGKAWRPFTGGLVWIFGLYTLVGLLS